MCDSTDGSNIVNWLIRCWPVSIIKYLCNNETDLLCDAERDAALKQKSEHPITSIHQRLINGIIKDLFLGRSDRGQNGRLDQVCWKGRQGALCHRITHTTEANQINRTRVQLGDSDIFNIWFGDPYVPLVEEEIRGSELFPLPVAKAWALGVSTPDQRHERVDGMAGGPLQPISFLLCVCRLWKLWLLSAERQHPY